MRRSDFSKIGSLRELRHARYENDTKVIVLMEEIAGECEAMKRWFSFGRLVAVVVSSSVSTFARFALLRRLFVLLSRLIKYRNNKNHQGSP